MSDIVALEHADPFPNITSAYLGEVSERAGKERAKTQILETLRLLEKVAGLGERRTTIEINHSDVHDFFEKRGFTICYPRGGYEMEISW